MCSMQCYYCVKIIYMKQVKDSNTAFYENMPLDTFQNFADQIGLANGEDLDVVFDSINKTPTLMEFGSGYGRILKALSRKNFQGNVIAVERVSDLVALLELKYSSKVKVLHEDLCDLEWEDNSIDTILWMWSGILELKPEDQQLVIKKAHSWLKEGGRLIIECPKNNSISKVGMLSNDKKVVVKEDWGVLDATLVDAEDIALYSSRAGFSSHSLQTYETTTHLIRAIYTLIK
ncbi:class I SAM-dependent methyltransferase [Flammeovirga kamogawensis]|nr:class I SAM-dependent methyltransferase [Flammeovirga kamogawensis]